MKPGHFLTLLALASCGFSPVYEKRLHSDMSARTQQIAISPVKGYDGTQGVDLRNQLMNRLTPEGKPAAPSYELDITVSQPSITDYTIKDDGTASSYLVRINADYKLVAKSSREIVLKRSATSEGSYNILKDQYSTEMLKMGAIRMLIDDLASQIYLSIVTHFAEG
jgi:hypothetical protein